MSGPPFGPENEPSGPGGPLAFCTLRAVRAALTLAAVIAAVSLLWLAGEVHRANCIASNQSGCGVLPWENGHPPTLGR